MASGLEDVRTVLANANANRPKGELANNDQTWGLSTTDQLLKAEDYQPLIVRYQNGAAVQLSDIGLVRDSVENVRAAGMVDGKPAVLVIVFRQPGANIIDTVDRVYAALPQLRASIPAAIKLTVVLDRTTTIRASVHDVEFTMMISIALVIMVVFLFLRNLRATLIPGVVVPLSLIGTFGVMYLLGYSLDNLSLMALTICTGFVVDDAIVVIENISRYREQGMSPFEAAIKGAADIGFTVISISISLVAVFIPILLMGGIVGRLFREFAVTLSAAVLVSLVISLTTTPMMAGHLLKPHGQENQNRWYVASERFFKGMLDTYERSLLWVLDHQPFTLMVFLVTLGLSIFLFKVVPKGFFPQQDTGRLQGSVQADQDTSFQAMKERLTELVAAIDKDPAVTNVIAFTGANGATNTANMFISLKPLSQRKISADLVIGRIRKEVAHIPGVNLYLQAVQDLRIGGGMSNAQYQFTLQSDDLDELNQWAPKVLKKLRTVHILTDVSSDQQNSGLESNVVVDRDTASRLGLSQQAIDDTLYDAFGQRQVSTMYTPLNQYHVVMEVAPQFWQNPDSLDLIHVRVQHRRAGQAAAPSRTSRNDTTALAVNHTGQFPSVTISFNLAPGVALGDAVDAINQAEAEIRPARRHSRNLPGHRAGVPGLAQERRLPDRVRALRGLHRARHSLRELHPSDHDSLDAALGRRRRTSRAAAFPHRAERDRADRHHPADRHREEERDHDDRLRARGSSAAKASRRTTRSTRRACCASGRS